MLLSFLDSVTEKINDDVESNSVKISRESINNTLTNLKWIYHQVAQLQMDLAGGQSEVKQGVSMLYNTKLLNLSMIMDHKTDRFLADYITENYHSNSKGRRTSQSTKLGRQAIKELFTDLNIFNSSCKVVWLRTTRPNGKYTNVELLRNSLEIGVMYMKKVDRDEINCQHMFYLDTGRSLSGDHAG